MFGRVTYARRRLIPELSVRIILLKFKLIKTYYALRAKFLDRFWPIVGHYSSVKYVNTAVFARCADLVVVGWIGVNAVQSHWPILLAHQLKTDYNVKKMGTRMTMQLQSGNLTPQI